MSETLQKREAVYSQHPTVSGKETYPEKKGIRLTGKERALKLKWNRNCK